MLVIHFQQSKEYFQTYILQQFFSPSAAQHCITLHNIIFILVVPSLFIQFDCNDNRHYNENNYVCDKLISF